MFSDCSTYPYTVCDASLLEDPEALGYPIHCANKPSATLSSSQLQFADVAAQTRSEGWHAKPHRLPATFDAWLILVFRFLLLESIQCNGEA